MPYVVPMNFGYKDQCLYLHSASSGKKIEILKNNNNVCFEIDIDTQLVKSERPCDYSMKYLSVIGFGKAIFLDEKQERKRALHIIVGHYIETAPYEYDEKLLDKLTIIKIEINQMFGKNSAY